MTAEASARPTSAMPPTLRPGRAPYRVLQQVAEQPGAVTVSGLTSQDLALARYHLKRAGYITVTHEGRRAHMAITPAGRDALSRSAAEVVGWRGNEARVLVLLAAEPLTTPQVVAQFMARYFRISRTYVWHLCSALEGQGLLDRFLTQPNTWMITPLGRFVLPEAHQRLMGLSPSEAVSHQESP